MCLISLLQICSCSLCVAALKFIQKMENYIVQSEIPTISLQERKVIKNDLCLTSFRIRVGKSMNIPVTLLCFLVYFHICVDLPHKGTCSHVSYGTWKTKTLCKTPFSNKTPSRGKHILHLQKIAVRHPTNPEGTM